MLMGLSQYIWGMENNDMTFNSKSRAVSLSELTSNKKKAKVEIHKREYKVIRVYFVCLTF